MGKKITKIEGLGEEGKDLLGTMNELLKKTGSVEKVTGLLVQAGKNYTKSLQESSSLLEKIAESVSDTSDGYSDLANKIRNIEDANNDLLKTFRVQNYALAQNLKVEEAESILARQDLVKQMIKKGLTVEQRKEILKEYDILQKNLKIQEQQQQAAERIKKIDGERSELMEKINEKAHIFKQALTDSKMRLALLTAGAIKLGGAFSEAYKELKEEGLSITQAAHEAMTSFTDSMSTGFMVSAKSIREARKAVMDTGGSLHDAEKAGKEAALMAERYGGSVASAGKAIGNLQKIPGLMKSSAQSTAEFGAKLAIAANVPADTVTKAVADNMDAAAKAGPNMTKSFALAAVNAKKIGVEFSTITGLADKLLDFESSINAQMEASVLLGKELNLDKAREAALAGDYATVQKEILKQVGSEAEFTKMNVLQKQKLAEAMGVSVGDLAKMVKGQGELADGTKIEEANRAKSAGFGADLYNWSLKNAGSLAAMVPSLIQMVMQMRMMQSMNKMSGGSGGLFGSLFGKGGKTPELPKTDTVSDAGKKMGGGGMMAGFKKNMKDLAGGLKAMGNPQVLFGIVNLALFAPAAVVAVAGIPFLLIIASVGTFIGIGLKALSKGLSAMADPLVAAGVGILSLLVLSVGAGMLMFGAGVGIAAAGMSLLVTSLKDVPFKNLIALPVAFMGIAVGLSAMALAGLAAMPAIGALIALATVAPALTGLGASLGGLFGGGKKEDKMDTLISRVDKLIAVAERGGTINMDGKKVGEVIRLSINSSGIR